MQNSIEMKETELQRMQLELVKVGADIEIEEKRLSPHECSLEERTNTIKQLKLRIEEATKTISAINNGKSSPPAIDDLHTSIRDSLLRGFVVCTNLRTAGRPDAPSEQQILRKLLEEFQLQEGMKI